MEKMTRTILMGMSLSSMAFAGAAFAQQAGSAIAATAPARRAAPANGVITRAQAEARATAMFQRMDVNKDGKLDKADREARQTARRAALFDRLDTDKNGQLSREEFSARPQRPEHAAKTPGAKGGKHHRWNDRRHRGGMMGRMADTDKNGAITQAEFTAAALQRFDRMDADKDGQVTQEERQAARKAMRDQWRAKRAATQAASPTK